MNYLILIVFIVLSVSESTAADLKQQTTTGCSPTVDNNGVMEIVCDEVDPKALKRLNELLDLKNDTQKYNNHNLRKNIKKAQEWSKKYVELKQMLETLGSEIQDALVVKKLLEEGSLVEAGEQYDRLIDIEETDLGRVASSHYIKASVFWLQFKSKDALAHYSKAYQNKPDNILYALAYGETLLELRRFRDAESVFFPVMTTLLGQTQTNPTAYEPIVGKTFSNRIMTVSSSQDHEDEDKVYHEVLEIYRILAQSNPTVYKPKVAMTLRNLGFLYSNSLRHEDDQKASQEALEIYRKLAESNPATYEFFVAGSLYTLGLSNNLLNLSNKLTQRFEDGTKAMVEALEIYRKLAKSNPTAYDLFIAFTLQCLGGNYKVAKRFDAGEKSYREAIEIFRKLAQDHPATDERRLADSLRELGNLYISNKRLDDGEKAYREALEIYRKLAQTNPMAFQAQVTKVQDALSLHHYPIY